jgi:threonyl-tRNA synthetase
MMSDTSVLLRFTRVCGCLCGRWAELGTVYRYERSGTLHGLMRVRGFTQVSCARTLWHMARQSELSQGAGRMAFYDPCTLCFDTHVRDGIRALIDHCTCMTRPFSPLLLLCALHRQPQDDAHVFCLPEQLEDELVGILDLFETILSRFGFTKYDIMLSTRPAKSVGTDEIWDLSTAALKGALQRKGWAYDVDEEGGAFYGPKVSHSHTYECTHMQ